MLNKINCDIDHVMSNQYTATARDAKVRLC